ncbi:LysR family transcriptional regulator [Roseomonas eburnea]|uniref:LysR family transcriptional regulator n=1 Tax=Neoroseomonas eburnea TaxID=1346889 RepID=A0A9X9XEN7_9PROT|nr:LysR substrate-binding domain-containing protein [Neoroseomonas eburnea]MBR0682173.1 LysR family transcriptional regulator [Neoroseomonas eburnea]
MRPTRLPSMEQLRALDAALRAGSFGRGGAALGLTHGAISRHIAALEEMLGAPLFQRGPRGAEPTALGTRYHAEIAPLLARIEEATRRAAARGRRRAQDDAGEVRVGVVPTFAARWLLPRLPAFTKAHPGIRVDVVATTELQDPQRNGLDFLVRHGLPPWPGLEAELLMAETLRPVRSPQFRLRGTPSLKAIAERLPLIFDVNRDHWAGWLAAAGWRGEAPSKGLVFSDFTLTLEAAAAGLGLALTRGDLAEREIASGRLVYAHPFVAPGPRAFHLAKTVGPLRRPAQVLWDWMRAQAAAPA